MQKPEQNSEAQSKGDDLPSQIFVEAARFALRGGVTTWCAL